MQPRPADVDVEDVKTSHASCDYTYYTRGFSPIVLLAYKGRNTIRFVSGGFEQGPEIEPRGGGGNIAKSFFAV